jgi:hypothetical protein
MPNKASVSELRSALATHRKKARRGRLPLQLSQRAMAYARDRHAQGASSDDIARELGVRVVTVTAWMRDIDTRAESVGDSTGLSLIPMVLSRQAPSPSTSGEIDIEFPSGVRIRASGMGRRALVEIIGAMGRASRQTAR